MPKGNVVTSVCLCMTSGSFTKSTSTRFSPSLQSEPLDDVLDRQSQSQTRPTLNVEEVDEDDDLSFESGLATQAMVAEHQALSHRVTRSSSRASSRGPSPGVLGLRTSGTNRIPDMEPVLEEVGDGEGEDSADNTQEVEAILADQETQATADDLPSNILELHLESAPPDASGLGLTPHDRNDKGWTVEAEQYLEEDIYSEDVMLGEGADHDEVTSRSKSGIRRNTGRSTQDLAPLSSSSSIRAYNQPSGSASAYVASVPAKRSLKNVDLTSTIVHRSQRLRESPFRIIPVHPEPVPARARSPGPVPKFADLDPAIARALAKMCKKFSFSPEEVRQKWLINKGNLPETYEVLEKNRNFLDQEESLMMDD